MSKKTKKTNKKKVHVMPSLIAEISPFDFSGKNPDNDARIIDVMTALEASEGWACFRQLFEMNLKIIETQILTKKNMDDEPLDDKAIDTLRDRWNIYKEVIDTPKKIRTKSVKKSHGKTESLDPYFSTTEEMIADDRKR